MLVSTLLFAFVYLTFGIDVCVCECVYYRYYTHDFLKFSYLFSNFLLFKKTLNQKNIFVLNLVALIKLFRIKKIKSSNIRYC